MLRPYADRLKKAIFCCSLLLSSYCTAQANPTPPDIAATAYILVDHNSGAVLAAKDPEKAVDPASLTKMMSVYVIDHELKNGRIHLQDEVTVSENAWKAEGSRMFIPLGKMVSVSDLLHGVIIQSGNDATVALAEFVAGKESAFVELMNQHAQKLGMKKTHFMNATGIPHPEHYTTAQDLSLLSRALITEFPETYKIYSEKWFTFNGIKQPNRNRLLWREPYVDGIKTGYSSTAGFCLSASAQKDNMRLLSIVVGAQTDNARTEQTLQLLRYGFRFYETHRLFEANTPISEPKLWMGASKTAPLGIQETLYITIPQGQYKNLDAKMLIDKRIAAPIAKGQICGKLVVKLEDEIIAQTPLIALQNLPVGSLWDRFSDYVSLGVYRLLNAEEVQQST